MIVGSLSVILSILFQLIAVGCMIRFGVNTFEYGLTQVVAFAWMILAMISYGWSYETYEASEGGKDGTHHGN